MRQFFKFLLASMVGTLLAALLVVLLFIGFVSVLVSSVDSGKKVHVRQSSVLHIRLDWPLTERTNKSPFAQFDPATFRTKSQPGLYDLVRAIDRAAGDDNIRGIYLNTPSVEGGLGSVEELRRALLRFRAGGKFVLSYAASYTQSAYYLASASDTIVLNPEGMVEFRGYLAEMLFFKGLFEKLEIEPQVIRHGKYKSALESLVNDRMSPENRQQIAELVDAFWQHTVQGIAEERSIEPDRLQVLADSFRLRLASDALDAGLVDGLLYEDQVLSLLARRSGLDSSDAPRLVPVDRYSRMPEKHETYTRDRIAVVFGSGEIGEGEGTDETIGSRTLVDALRSARTDESVKAIVLRVNSPGGSALASDEIWREVTLAAETKPVVASMGALAASGGYYISCGATRIVAEPNTITGSIGVIGVLFNIRECLNNKLGITSDQYKTGRYADLGMPTHPLTDGEKAIIGHIIDDIYKDFTGKVARGRRLPDAYVDSIGQGRVWGGEDALELGLVDTLGSLTDAIALAAGLAGVESYRIRELPVEKEPLQQLLEGFGTRVTGRLATAWLGTAAPYYRQAKALETADPIQARMPYHITIQ